ncbi:MAG: hypothetical protein AABY14_03040 [Nanoarchaeota archaeon]|mgnify:CR=1
MEYGKQIYKNGMNSSIGSMPLQQLSGLPGRRLPEKKFRAGGISVSIWQNVGVNKKGEQSIYKSISLEKNYKDKNGMWHKSNSFRINDLPQVVLLLNKAYEFILLKQNIYEGGSITHIVKDEVIEEEIVI